MSIYRGTYYSASSCTGSARPGAKALMSWYLGAYSNRGAANLGIYVCKRLGSGYSIHGHGRACDLGTKPYNNPGGNWPTWGWALANALLNNSKELGIQLIIFRGKVWSCRYPDSGFRKYTGFDPHDGHMHVELIPATAASLTVDRIERTIGGSNASPSVPTTGAPDPTLREGDIGPRVGQLQRALNEALDLDLAVDDDFGPAVAGGVKLLQRRAGITQDEIYGDDSAEALRDLLEDDVQLTDKIKLVTGQEVPYSNEEWTVAWTLASTHYYVLQARNQLAGELAAAKLRDEAILAAVKGLDTKAVIAAVNAAAAADAQRDTALLAEVQELASGGATAQEVYDLLVSKLTRADE